MLMKVLNCRFWVHHMGFRTGFLFLAAVALAAFVILYLFMPETRNIRQENA